MSETDRSKILAQITLMEEGDYSVLYTKKLEGPVRELIVKQHRILYFQKNDTLCFVGAFKKQSAKTPKRKIEHAKALYKDM